MSIHRSSTILFIDHTEDRQHWVLRLKTSLPDCVVLEASTGKEGLAICRSQQVECVISELALPDISGFEVLLELIPKPRRSEIAFIFLTRLTVSPIRQRALNNGAQAYLFKSQCTGDELDGTIHTALARITPPRKEPCP